MKFRILLLSLLAIMLSTSTLFAGQADDFKIDKQKVQDEFADLSRLEQTVADHNYLTLSELKEDSILSAEFASMDLSSNMMMESALGIPGFWWGCIFGLVGILIVYLVTDNDRAEVKSAFTGCIISSVASTVFYLIYYFAVISVV